MYTVNVVDAPCGQGKTNSAINYINNSDDDERFLYITPFLTEVERIKKSCIDKKFKEPKKYGTKLNGIKYLFNKGDNIVSTHSLFRLFDEEIINLSYLNNYTLIMDEVADVVDILDISKDDMGTLLDKYVEVDDKGLLHWTATDYEGKFEDYKRLCELGCVSIYGSGTRKVILLWMFPVSVFKAFKKIYILTYMFDAQIQKYYYDFYNVNYNHIYVDNDRFTNDYKTYDIGKYRSLIDIVDSEKLNSIGDLDNSLSSAWYLRNKDNNSMKKIKSNCHNFFQNITNTSSELNIWTVFKDYQNLIKGKGYTKGFVPLNMRATNDYINCRSVAYLVNRYLNPMIKNFFIENNVIVDEDKYALSELLQFIFRSRVRQGEKITLYLPSKRMRNLLLDWLNT